MVKVFAVLVDPSLVPPILVQFSFPSVELRENTRALCIVVIRGLCTRFLILFVFVIPGFWFREPVRYITLPTDLISVILYLLLLESSKYLVHVGTIASFSI